MVGGAASRVRVLQVKPSRTHPPLSAPLCVDERLLQTHLETDLLSIKHTLQQVLCVWARTSGGLEAGLRVACAPSPLPPSQQPVSGTADPRSSQTGQVIRGLR